MIIEIIPPGGIGQVTPLRIQAAQIVIRQSNGTPIAVAAEFGDPRAYALSMIGQPDFVTMLRNLGIHETVICDALELAKPPPGARLVAGPTP